ncbi:hypothetical protein [Paracoccus shandongensis]|uniref:hypothetical protein n=1 Tax=Paracoccus shandongensis TaxID=2816048 RepID=UPI001A8E9D4D|nr:hypothetical protein [Paracoccus shandongensis]
MQAFRILLHAIRQVFGNFRQALGLLAMPVAIQAVLLASAVLLGANIRGTQPGIGPISLMLALMLGAAACVVWFAVRWHRFVLLDESKNLLAPPSRAAFWRYVGTMVLTVILMIPAMLVTIGVLYAVHQGGIPVLTFIAILVLSVLLYALTLVLGTALPGAAVGAHRPIGAAWRALKPAAGTIVLLTIMGLVSYEVIEAMLDMFLAIGLPTSLVVILSAIAYWLSTFIGLSVVTTLWGHFVEGRPLR